MAKKQSVKQLLSAMLMLLSAAALQIMMFCPLFDVNLPLSKPFSVSWCGVCTLMSDIRAVIGGADIIESSVFWSTLTVWAAETGIVMIAIGGIKRLLSDDASARTFAMLGGGIATAVLTVAAYILYDTAYEYVGVHKTAQMTATVWLMPIAALLAVGAAAYCERGNKTA